MRLPNFTSGIIIAIGLFTIVNNIDGQNNYSLKLTKSADRKLEREAGLFNSENTQLLGFAIDSLDNSYILKSVPEKKSKYNSLEVDIYNSDLKFSKSKKIDLIADKEFAVQLEGLYQINNKPVIFYSQYDKTKDIKTIYYTLLSENGSSTVGKKLIAFATSSKSKGNFDVFYSIDSSKIMINVVVPQKSKEDLVVRCEVYDNHLEKFNSYDIEIGWPARKITTKWMVSNKGFPMLFIETPREKKDSKYGKFQKEIRIYENQDKPKILALNIPDKNINALLNSVETNDEISFVGTFEHIKSKGTLGTVYFKINTATNKIVLSNINTFKKEIFDFYNIKPSKSAKGVGMNYLLPFSISKTTKNNSYLFLDTRYLITRRYKNNTVTTYYSDNKMVVKFDTSGNIIYERIIPSRVESVDYNEGLSSKVFSHNENIIVIYNSHEDNINRGQNKPISTNKDVFKLTLTKTFSLFTKNNKNKNNIAMANIDEKGIVKLIPITSFRTDNMKIADPQAYYNQKSGTFVFATADDKEFKILKGEFIETKPKK